nr:hypothetical protein [Caldilineaceae bacterium]
MKQHWRTLLIVGAALLAFWAVTALAQGEPPAGDSPLPLPSTLPLDAYEVQLYDFLGSRAYADLAWVKDKRVRDTGPYIDGRYYGTHPAVRIYYSPEVYAWLKAGRQ